VQAAIIAPIMGLLGISTGGASLVGGGFLSSVLGGIFNREGASRGPALDLGRMADFQRSAARTPINVTVISPVSFDSTEVGRQVTRAVVEGRVAYGRRTLALGVA
jgi:hypothetical protein